MEIVVILGMIILATLLANRAPKHEVERIDALEERMDEVGGQVADFMINDD